MAFSQGFEDKLMDIAEWVDSNKYLNSIKDAFTVFMPFVIVGSFGTLLNTLITSTTTGLAQWIPALTILKPAFTAINFCCLSFMTIPVIYLIAHNIAKHNKAPELATGLVCIAAYISMVSPTTVQSLTKLLASGQTLTDGTTSVTVTAMAQTIFGAQGLFVGMLVGILVAELFDWLCGIDAIKIKMPPSVPAGIANSFNVMVPVFFTLVITAVFGALFQAGTGSYINDWVYKVLQSPMEGLFQTMPGILIAVILSQFFWFLGIHGGLVISPVRNPIFVAAIAANVAAFNAGGTPDRIFTQGFWMEFIAPGGAGMTLCLLIAIFLFSKRDDYRSVAKLAILPGICGISEPVVFGIPLVLNPTFAIPFIFNSSISAAIAMVATNIGFMPCNTVDIPFGVPIFLNAFLGHGWQGLIVQVICLTVCTLVWIPFVLISNKEAEREAQKALEDEDAPAIEAA